jgi:hypothetical protein
VDLGKFGIWSFGFGTWWPGVAVVVVEEGVEGGGGASFDCLNVIRGPGADGPPWSSRLRLVEEADEVSLAGWRDVRIFAVRKKCRRP